MRVVFNHPPTGSANPFNDFRPTNPTHYPNSSGIYIYGLKLNIKIGHDIINKFVPIYIGTAKNLRDRLFVGSKETKGHFKEESYYPSLKGWSKSLKEIFDFSFDTFSLDDIKARYKDMLEYDEFNDILILFPE